MILLDHQHAAHGPGIPTPTPTAVRLGLVVEHGAYGGAGRLRLTSGTVRLYEDALLTRPIAFDATHPLELDHAALVAGRTLHALGGATGNAQLQLELQPQANVNVQGPATATATVIELTLAAYELEPHGRRLEPTSKLRRGKLVGIPRPHARTRPGPIELSSSAPDASRRLRLELQPAGGVVAIAGPPGASADGIGHDLAEGAGPRRAYLEGRGAAGTSWLTLSLVLADGTVLHAGDCLKVRTCLQHRPSVGFEWELNGTCVDRRHDDAGVLLPESQWEGLPSKATAYQSGNGMKLDTEVGHDHLSYGEVVTGPAYDFAQLETQLGEVVRLLEDTWFHRVVRVTCPAPIVSRDSAAPTVWMPAGRTISFAASLSGPGGTAQASFGVPLWHLPSVLALVDRHDGSAAKQRAEEAAAADHTIDEHVMGLVAACEYYIRCFAGRPRVGDDDGPKTCVPVMFRTDFHAMHRSLSGPQRTAFDAWAAAHPASGAWLLPNGYSLGGGQIQPHGPLIGDWLGSIGAPPGHGDDKDLMSPPPGFPRHHTRPVIPYGMGVLGTDPSNGHVIAESRDFGQAMGTNAFVEQAMRWSDAMLLEGRATWIRDQDGWRDPNAHQSRRRGRKAPYTPHI